MIFINHNYTSPYFNAAAEEYILKNFKDECFMLWRNAPCILIGKNQNTLSQINIDYVNKKNIKVVRRITGGGAVFNDLNNINFSFISNSSENCSKNFRKFTYPIIKALNNLSIDATFSGRNDILVDGKKISGNAQYYYKGRVLHHGTLLFKSSMNDLVSALKVDPLKFKDKAVKSVSSRVTNISEYLKSPLTTEEFKDYIMNYVCKLFNEDKPYSFTEKDLYLINNLAEEKFSSWDWNYGLSPKYTYKKAIKFEGGTIEVNFNVSKGIITSLKFYGDFFFVKDIKDLENKFINCIHSKSSILNILENINIHEYINGITKFDILNLMF